MHRGRASIWRKDANLKTLAGQRRALTATSGFFGFDLSNNCSNDNLNISGVVSNLAGTIQIRALASATSLLTTSQAYTLITAGGGSSLSASHFSIQNAGSELTVNGVAYLTLSLSSDSTHIYLTATAEAANQLFIGTAPPACLKHLRDVPFHILVVKAFTPEDSRFDTSYAQCGCHHVVIVAAGEALLFPAKP